MDWPALEHSLRQAAERADRKEITAVNPTTGQRIRLHGRQWVDYYTGVPL
jgi:hypothetical protein